MLWLRDALFLDTQCIRKVSYSEIRLASPETQMYFMESARAIHRIDLQAVGWPFRYLSKYVFMSGIFPLALPRNDSILEI